MTFQTEIHLCIFLLEIEQIITPTLAINNDNIGLSLLQAITHFCEECMLQSCKRIVLHHPYFTTSIDIQCLLQALELILLQQIRRVLHLKGIPLLLISLLQHIDSIRNKVVKSFLIRYKGILNL